nr:hypothetical protein CFP56_56123 [Quercus suber]
MDEYIYTEPTGRLASIEKNFKICLKNPNSEIDWRFRSDSEDNSEEFLIHGGGRKIRSMVLQGLPPLFNCYRAKSREVMRHEKIRSVINKGCIFDMIGRRDAVG